MTILTVLVGNFRVSSVATSGVMATGRIELPKTLSSWISILKLDE